MKVLHVIPSLSHAYGGPTRALAGYVRASLESRISPTVAAPRPSDTDLEWFRSLAGDSEMRLFASFGGGAFVTSPGLFAWLVGAASRYDVVHVHGLINPISSSAMAVAIRRNVATIVRPFGMLSRFTMSHRRTAAKRIYFRAFDAPSLRAADGIHFTTHAECEQAAWHGIDFLNRAFIIPPPLVPQDVPRAGDQAEPYRVLFLARLHPVKNLEALLLAWPRVIASVPGATLVVAGAGEARYERSLHVLAESLGVVSTVEFCGEVAAEAKRKLLSSAAAFVLPSHHESFGIAVLEALAAEIPVIVSPNVQLADAIAKNQIGTVVDSDPEALAAAIVRVLTHREYGRTIAQRGAEFVKRAFGQERIGAELLHMYETVAR